MEVDPSRKGFQIKTGRIPILLTLKRIRELKPHEETVPSDLHGIVSTFEQDPVLRHPIIADSATGAVLDGTHRLAALSQLGCYTIPTALIDYQNPLVKVDRWFRVITGESLTHFMKRMDQSQSIVGTSASEADQRLLSRLSYAALCNEKECFTVGSKGLRGLEACRSAFQIEENARNSHLKISYTDSNDVKGLLRDRFLMSTIRVEKSEVIESCLSHSLFPPKSTRHLIPSRPLGLSFPLDWLKSKNYLEAESVFETHIRSKRIKRLPEGSKVGSRRYLEEVFLFE